ncbi:MAG: hypothetical protein R3D00_22765 [Bacteroidia bacterium]
MEYINYNLLEYDYENNLETLNGFSFSGIAYEIRNDGCLEEVMIVGGMKNGYCRTWYPSKTRKSEEHYFNNSLHGISWEWYENGQMKKESIYEYSVKVKETEWDLFGNIIVCFKIEESSDAYILLNKLRKYYNLKEFPSH